MTPSRGALWIQEGTEIDNPYFGQAMRDCGDFHETVPPGAYLPQPVEPRRPPPAAPHEEHRH